ncbi:phage portal protein [Acinetobacter baumannii]|uniref:phage portal protein n=1 Tax=Acinetobacter baumannii TaxID=470 RepID=UPI002B05DDEA|nr:phage portal protein [Acinetobacter baumannii]
MLRGNTYVWKLRDVFGEVYRMVVLNPDLVCPLVDDYGNVFYQFNTDRLTQTESVIVPASEIIHDRINAFYHPLVGLTPIMACGIAAGMGIKILNNGTNFFSNGSRPGGILVAPGAITPENAKKIQTEWNQKYSGVNVGASPQSLVMAWFYQLGMSAADSQMIEQLGMTAKIVCTAFNVPPFKVGVVDVQGTTEFENLNEIYYSDCLQALIEAKRRICFR